MKPLIRTIETYISKLENGCVVWNGPTRCTGSKQTPTPCLPEAPARSIARIYYRSVTGRNVPSGMHLHGRKCGNPLCIAPQHLNLVVQPMHSLDTAEVKWTL